MKGFHISKIHQVISVSNFTYFWQVMRISATSLQAIYVSLLFSFVQFFFIYSLVIQKSFKLFTKTIWFVKLKFLPSLGVYSYYETGFRCWQASCYKKHLLFYVQFWSSANCEYLYHATCVTSLCKRSLQSTPYTCVHILVCSAWSVWKQTCIVLPSYFNLPEIWEWHTLQRFKDNVISSFFSSIITSDTDELLLIYHCD